MCFFLPPRLLPCRPLLQCTTDDNRQSLGLHNPGDCRLTSCSATSLSSSYNALDHEKLSQQSLLTLYVGNTMPNCLAASHHRSFIVMTFSALFQALLLTFR